MKEEPPMHYLAAGLITVGSLGLLAISAVMLSGRISRREEARGPGWIVGDGEGRELLERLREGGM